MIKFGFLPLLFMLCLPPLFTADDDIATIAALFKKGNATELSKHFAANIDLTILKDENVYSRTQAEIILKKFFERYKPKDVKVLHKVNTSNTYRFGVLLLTTDNGSFRISFTLNSAKNVMQVIDLRIETEKP